ncbi:hypothetical protein B0H19DRAFT_1057355 [Mycena capillaripes]|nr:hypothetical protein B0H19DRAFT_1057355 [Mycena capillaripes]
MPIDIVLTQLGPWAEGHWTSLLLAMTSMALKETLNRFVAQNATVTLNGEAITQDSYKQQLPLAVNSNTPCTDSSNVTFLEVIEIPANDISSVKAGVVALVYNSTCTDGISSVHLGAVGIYTAVRHSIERIAAECPRPPAGIRGYCGLPISSDSNSRRVVSIDHLLQFPTSIDSFNASQL